MTRVSLAGARTGPRRLAILPGPCAWSRPACSKVPTSTGSSRWSSSRSPSAGGGPGTASAIRAATRSSTWARTCPARERPDGVAAIVGWVRRLRADHGEGTGGGLAVHRSSDPGHWIITFPWTGAERALTLTEAALALAERDVSPSRTARLTGAQERLLARWTERIDAARTTPPEWLRDADRRVPIVSISGTNGKSTVTRLITHVLRRRRHGMSGRPPRTASSSTSGWSTRATGPAPAARTRSSPAATSSVAVLETARGGIVLRGVGYESNDASVLTNVSSDHLDLQGIHTLPELAEVKSTICRITRPDGWVVLNARRPAGQRCLAPRPGQRRAVHAATATLRRSCGTIASAADGRYLVRDGVIVEANGATETDIIEVGEVPITIGGLARHNVANALAAAGGARGLGATIAQVRDGLAAFAPDAARSPGRLNLFRLGARVVIVDFAHNEAGVSAVLDVAEGIAAGAAGRAAPITAIIGTAGDRPDDTLRGIGRIAAERAQRVAIKQTLEYLRGRTAESVVGELMVGVVAGGVSADRCPDLRLRDGRPPRRAERSGRRRRARRQGRRGAGHRADVPRGSDRGVRAAREAGRPAGGRRVRAHDAGAAPAGSTQTGLIRARPPRIIAGRAAAWPTMGRRNNPWRWRSVSSSSSSRWP